MLSCLYVYVSTSVIYEGCRDGILRHMLERAVAVCLFTRVLWESWWDCKCSVCSWNSGGDVCVCGPLSDEHRQNTEHGPCWVRPGNKWRNNVCTGCMQKLTGCFHKMDTMTEICVHRFSFQYSHIHWIIQWQSLSWMLKPEKCNIKVHLHVIIQPNVTQFRSEGVFASVHMSRSGPNCFAIQLFINFENPFWRRSPPPEEILPPVPVRLMAS